MTKAWHDLIHTGATRYILDEDDYEHVFTTRWKRAGREWKCGMKRCGRTIPRKSIFLEVFSIDEDGMATTHYCLDCAVEIMGADELPGPYMRDITSLRLVMPDDSWQCRKMRKAWPPPI